MSGGIWHGVGYFPGGIYPGVFVREYLSGCICPGVFVRRVFVWWVFVLELFIQQQHYDYNVYFYVLPT